MDETLERAKKFFDDQHGFATDKELAVLFTDEELKWLQKEGHIEVTVKPELWAWKG